MWKTSVPQRCFLTQFEGWIQGGCERVLKALQQGHYIRREADTPTGSLAVLWNHCNQRRTSLQMIWETLIRSDLALFFSYPMFFFIPPIAQTISVFRYTAPPAFQRDLWTYTSEGARLRLPRLQAGSEFQLCSVWAYGSAPEVRKPRAGSQICLSFGFLQLFALCKPWDMGICGWCSVLAIRCSKQQSSWFVFLFVETPTTWIPESSSERTLTNAFCVGVISHFVGTTTYEDKYFLGH